MKTISSIFSKEIVDCTVTSEATKLLVLENGQITDVGLNVAAVNLSPVSFKFRRFSTKVNIATELTVEENCEK